MKTFNLLVAASAAFVLASCGGAEEPATDENPTPEVEMKSLSVDTENSTLGWKGMKSEEYFHTGKVMFSEGTAEFVDGNLANGTFVVDLTKIVVSDEALPEDKKAMLAGHLASPDYFNTAEHGSVDVKVGQLEAGSAPVTITVMGQTIETSVPLTVAMTDAGATITGSFDVDFSSLERPGFQPKEGQPDHVLPTIKFDLNMMLK